MFRGSLLCELGQRIAGVWLRTAPQNSSVSLHVCIIKSAIVFVHHSPLNKCLHARTQM